MTPADTVDAYLAEQGIASSRAGEAVWTFSLSGDHKKSLPVVLEQRETTLGLQAFFIRRPFEHADEVYRMLLSRNFRRSPVRFAADADGDIYLVGEVPLDALTPEALDELLGATLATADQLFDPVIALGFATYLARDLAWREKAGTRDHET